LLIFAGCKASHFFRAKIYAGNGDAEIS